MASQSSKARSAFDLESGQDSTGCASAPGCSRDTGRCFTRGTTAQLHALACNFDTCLRCIELPEAMAGWSLSKIGARGAQHVLTSNFQLAEMAVTGGHGQRQPCRKSPH